MRDQQELELKWALTAAEHARLLAQLTAAHGAPHLLAQENRFFDTADRRLRAQRMNVRIRRENRRWVLTCKHKEMTAVATADGLSAHREWEDDLPPAAVAGMAAPDAAWTASLPLPAPFVTLLAGASLQALGGFANQRSEWHVTRDGLAELLCLDQTQFAGRVDYELEIETADPAATATFWRAQFAAWHIPVVIQPLTKFARFLALESARA